MSWKCLEDVKNVKFDGEISNNSLDDLLETNVYKTLEFCWKSLLTSFKRSNIA